jgi:hypothetical protein
VRAPAGTPAAGRLPAVLQQLRTEACVQRIKRLARHTRRARVGRDGEVDHATQARYKSNMSVAVFAVQ